MTIVYYCLLLLFYFLGILEIVICNKKDISFLHHLALIFLIFFVGLKTAGGTDFLSYGNIFQNVSRDVSFALSSGIIEPLFVLLIYTVYIIGGGFQLFYLIVATINLSIKVHIFDKLVPYLFPALLIYFVGLFFERDNDGIRQGFSIAFCYLSIIPLLADRRKQFLFLNLIACLIHYSSIVFLLSYVLNKIRISDFYVFLIVALAFVFPFLGLSLFDLLLGIVPIPAVTIKLSQYADNSVYSANLGINIGLIFRFFILCLFIYYHRSLKIAQNLYNLLRNGFAFAIVLSLLFSDFEIIAHRLPYAFREFQIMIVPFFLTIAKGKGNKIVLLTIIFVYSLLLLSRFLSGEASNAYLYDNLLFHIIDYL